MRINCGTSVERQKGIENASQNILRGGQRADRRIRIRDQQMAKKPRLSL